VLLFIGPKADESDPLYPDHQRGRGSSGVQGERTPCVVIAYAMMSADTVCEKEGRRCRNNTNLTSVVG